MTDSEDDLNAAYALKTPDDSKRLYGAWAESYDTSFARELVYRLPEHVAEALARLRAPISARKCSMWPRKKASTHGCLKAT